MDSHPDNDAELQIRRFINCLSNATAEVPVAYMQLPVAGEKSPIFRERVYCYELYHQLRLLVGNDFGYNVGGEVDKRGHRFMNAPGIRNTKPDLLVHRPGYMVGNLIVIEVKPVSVTHRTQIRKDLQTLTAYRQNGSYRAAIYLIYGDMPQRLQAIIHKAHQLEQDALDPPIDLSLIDLYWHRRAGDPAEHHLWRAI